MCMKPEFLNYFDEVRKDTQVKYLLYVQIAQGVFGDRYADFLSELTKRLKLNTKLQLIIALSLAESCPENAKPECKWK